MKAFVYQADIYCENCAHALNLPIAEEGDTNVVAVEIDMDVEEWDYPVHCTNCGLFLENRLTSEGERYVLSKVRQALETGNITPVIEEWMIFYSYLPFTYSDG
jgi:uncharacterized Zn finger protein